MSHDLLTRRKLLKGLGAAALCSPFLVNQAWAARQQSLYVDGLSFLPDDINDVKASKLSA